MPRLYRSAFASDYEGAGDKSDWIAESLSCHRTKSSKRVKVVTEPLLVPGTASDYAERLLGETHDVAYIHAVASGQPQSLAETAVRPWRHIEFLRAVDQALAIAGAASEVANTQREGSSSRIVGAIGGSTHHARRAAGRFGSVFNSVAAVALRMRADHAVLILDFDGSCAGGTAELIAEVPRVRLVDVAVNNRDTYDATPNASVVIVSSAAEYLDVVNSALISLDVAKERNAFCIYSAGVDGFEGMEHGLSGITADILAERDRMVFAWCRRVGLRTVYTLGGGEVCSGCPKDTLVALHRTTIETAAMAAS